MTQLIPPSELEALDEFQLRSKFCKLLNDVARSQKAAAELPLQLATLQNVERALVRKRIAPKRLPGPKLG